ncbi:beta-glucuronosyltransferase GlcAT14A [Pyrus communis]|uniref:beta-glucuronosyltransferase GlcAT14A n=1 Tax=Pyrus communis TaxID=23211 RepID=UPI0035C17F36
MQNSTHSPSPPPPTPTPTPSPFLSSIPAAAAAATAPILSIKDPKALLSIILVSSLFALLLFLSSSSSSSLSSSAAPIHSRPDPFLFPNQQAHRIIYHDNNSSDPTPPSIAYLLSGSKGDLGRILRLLYAAYHPRNQYLLHLDRSASDSEREKLALRVQSLPIFRAAQNVHVIGKADFVYPTGSSAISFTLHGASILLRLSPNWDWFISLSVRDYPLITQDDLLHIMSFLPKDLNFVNHSSYIGWRESRRLRPIIVDPGLYLSEKTDMFYATQKRVLPNAYRLFSGSSFTILSRNFIEFCVVGIDNLPRTLLMYFSNTPAALSNYFPTILCNSQQFNKTIINHNLVYANSETPPREKPQPISSADYDAMIQHGAAFATGLRVDDPILDRVDREILKRRRGKVVPGGWCLGGFANDTCSVWGDADILRPSPQARRLEQLLVGLLSNGTFLSHQCIYE